jgi:predicted N-acetyltransferase YhbS
MHLRNLRRDEIETIWTIDRSEVIERIYRLKDDKLVLEPDYFDVRGWPPGEAVHMTELLVSCYDRGGLLTGSFDSDRLVGVAALDTILLGPQKSLLQLLFLHVDHSYRGRGVGVRLFEHMRHAARELGASGLYISATPSEHTIHFYQRRGCVVTPVPDPELFAREPEDIHLECMVAVV